MPSLDDIARHRYQTGAYGRAHVRMREADFRRLIDERPAPRTPPPWAPGPTPMSQLMSIPIVADETIEAGRWQLVDNATLEVIEEGAVST